MLTFCFVSSDLFAFFLLIQHIFHSHEDKKEKLVVLLSDQSGLQNLSEDVEESGP